MFIQQSYKTMTDTFLTDILTGFEMNPKTLPSKYFYDTAGSKLFQMIMQLPEYYLTKSEYEILDTQSNQIFKDFNPKSHFDIVEFGAGDGSKTKLLLKEFMARTNDFDYSPVDISISALEELEENFRADLPNLNINLLNDDYFSALESLKLRHTTKLVLFLGSNIGNFKDNREIQFLHSMRSNLNRGDYALIGFDLKKDPHIILDAYNDKTGITREFNLNLLRRMNRELGANFDIFSFTHFPTYNPINGEARSFLVSLKKQTVNVGMSKIQFEYGEPIFMEVSKKYALADLEKLSANSGFEIVQNYYDCKHYFLDSLWRAV